MVVFRGLIALSFAGTVAIKDGFEPVPGVRTIGERLVACFMVDLGPGKVALIDAGMDHSAKNIIAELARRGLKPEAVRAILVTHGHRDHIGGIPMFPGAEVYALEADVALVEGRAGSHSPMGRFFEPKPTGIKVGHALKDGQVLRLGRTVIRVFAVPGHTMGSAAYLVNGALFIDDSADIMKDGKLRGAKWVFSESQAQNRESLKALARRLKPSEVKYLVPSHSGAFPGMKPLLDYAAAK
jgi:glyoxylase-like metal-dependent hydrolase (beta-lactamase superfamily II)